MKTHLLLIDALNLVRRIYEADPNPETGTFVERAADSLTRALEAHEPSHVAVVWDSQADTWRHRLDDQYKANRSPTPTELVSRLPQLEQAFLDRGAKSITVENYEADDVIATLASGVAGQGGKVTILSTDKMFYPLLSDHIYIYHHFERRSISRDEVTQRFELRIDQLVDYWALSGDNSNNVKGIPGIGKKTATKLLQEQGDLEAILRLDDNKHIRGQKEQARRCRQMVALKTDVAVGVNLKALRYAGSGTSV